MVELAYDGRETRAAESEDVFGKNVDGIDPLADSRRGLVDTAAGLLLFEYFRNRVQSFKNTPRF